MAKIYSYNGRRVYDDRGQTFDANTGQVVNKTAPVQQTQVQQPVSQAPIEQQQAYQQPVNTGQRQYVRIDQDMGGGATGQRRFFERSGDQLVPVTNPETLRRLDASQILFDTERRQINFQNISSQQPQFPTIDLEPGNRSPEVEKLQNWLIQQGFNIPAGATGFYGKQTKAAVEAWQRANGVEGGQNFGFWGPKSRQVALSTFQQQNLSRGSINAQYEHPGAGLGAGKAVNENLAGLPPEFLASYAELDKFLQRLYRGGASINPLKQITESDVAQFLKRAELEVEPFYKEKLRVARGGFLSSIGYTRDEILNTEKQLEQQYGKAVRSIASEAAERGLAQSGLRETQERELAEGTQNAIDTARRQLSFNTGQRALEFASKFGSQNLPSFNLQNAPRAISGQESFERPSGERGLYDVSNGLLSDIVGSQVAEKASGVRELGQFYEKQERNRRVLTL